MKAILTAFARNRVFANIVLLILFAGGGLAALSMIRETFPEFSLDMITITVPYPGATPEEVEAYAASIEFVLDGQQFCDTYQKKGWMIGSSPMRDWQAAVRLWKRTENKPVTNKPVTNKPRLLAIPGKICSTSGCKMPAVYKAGGDYDHYYCTDHMPAKVKERYQ